jgi:hypothetical protein
MRALAEEHQEALALRLMLLRQKAGALVNALEVHPTEVDALRLVRVRQELLVTEDAFQRTQAVIEVGEWT